MKRAGQLSAYQVPLLLYKLVTIVDNSRQIGLQMQLPFSAGDSFQVVAILFMWIDFQPNIVFFHQFEFGKES